MCSNRRCSRKRDCRLEFEHVFGFDKGSAGLLRRYKYDRIALKYSIFAGDVQRGERNVNN